MKSYYRVMLGRGSKHAELCLREGFIGVGFDLEEDLSGQLPEEWREFNRRYVPIYLAKHPDKKKVSAGLACGAIWTIAKGIKKGDIVLCPDGTGVYRVGEVTGDYYYAPGQELLHRRRVKWFDKTIERAAMSEALRNSTGSIGTYSDITSYHEEIEKLLAGATEPGIITNHPEIEDPVAFAMERHLEDFLVQNWGSTVFGKTHDIYAEDGELVGKQYPTDSGPIDVLAVSRDRKELLVIELKRGRASDAVVGQLLRYMGYVMEELAEEGQQVHGVIIALDDDLRLRRALAAARGITFYRYQVDFKLVKGHGGA